MLAATLLPLSASFLAKLGGKSVVCSLIQEGIQACEESCWFQGLKWSIYLAAGFWMQDPPVVYHTEQNIGRLCIFTVVSRSVCANRTRIVGCMFCLNVHVLWQVPHKETVYSLSAWTSKQKSGSVEIPSVLLNNPSMQLLELLDEFVSLLTLIQPGSCVTAGRVHHFIRTDKWKAK